MQWYRSSAVRIQLGAGSDATCGWKCLDLDPCMLNLPRFSLGIHLIFHAECDLAVLSHRMTQRHYDISIRLETSFKRQKQSAFFMQLLLLPVSETHTHTPPR